MHFLFVALMGKFDSTKNECYFVDIIIIAALWDVIERPV